MPFYTNNENAVWNTNHLGCRVPVNDTGLEGAPFNLGGDIPSWEDGSINKAVYETYLLTENPIVHPDDAQAQNYQLPFSALLKYINKEMLYGYNADSRYTIPGNLGALRAYPTSIVISDTLTILKTFTYFSVDFAGNKILTPGQFLIVAAQVDIKYKVPYDIVFTLTFFVDAVQQAQVEARIQSGSLKITDYRLVGETNWSPVSLNRIPFSFDTSLSSTTLDVSSLVTNFVQVPYYGTFNENHLLIEEPIYNPDIGSTPIASDLGPSYLGVDLYLYLHITDACPEIAENDLSPFEDNPSIYLKDTDTLQVGTRLWKDNMATIPADENSYMFVQYSYYSNFFNQNIYVITRYFRTDASGFIIMYEQTVVPGYLGPMCYGGIQF